MNSSQTETAQTPRLPVPSAQHSGNGLQPLLSMRAAPAALGASWPASSKHINSGLEGPRQESAHRAPGHHSHRELPCAPRFRAWSQVWEVSLLWYPAGAWRLPLSYRIFSCFRNLKHRPSWPDWATAWRKAAGNMTRGSALLDSPGKEGTEGGEAGQPPAPH